MSALVLYMSMSLDGYIAGSNNEPGNPGGDDFDQLHEWVASPDGSAGHLLPIRITRQHERRSGHKRYPPPQLSEQGRCQ
jgi:hypothetical protein